MGLLVIAVPLQILLALLIRQAPLFYLTAAFSLLLIFPLMMQSAATPAMTISDEGILLQPVLWRERFVAWREIERVQPYPLLPPSDTESLRKALVGRKNYHPAEGVMLLIPSLPFPYRATGFFVGEGFRPVVAITNRTHQHYEQLIQQLQHYLATTGDDDEP